MSVIDHLYFRLFSLGKVMAIGLKRPHYRAAFLGTLASFFYGTAILKLFGVSLAKDYLLLILGIVLVLYLAWIKFFLNPQRYRAVMTQFNAENIFLGMLGNIITALVIIFSIVLFVLVNTSK